MNQAYTDAILEAFAIAPAHEVIYDTLEIRQEGVQDPIFIVKGRRALVATDEDDVERTFEPVGFSITRPASTEDGFQSLNVSIDNVSRRVSDFVEIAKSTEVPVKVIYRPFLSSDLTQPHMNPPLVLFLKDIQMTELFVTGRATFMDIVNKKFPNDLYTRERFPSLG